MRRGRGLNSRSLRVCASLGLEEGFESPLGRRRLVYLLVTGRGELGADRDRRADLLELKVVGLRAVLDDVGQVLGVAGVPNTLDAHTLVAVATLAGNGERLIEIAALGLLLGLLAHLGYGRDGRQSEHC